MMPLTLANMGEENLIHRVGGILAGFSNGLVLTCGASCGGLDILGLYLSKKTKGFTVGRFSLLFNAVLYAMCLVLFSAPTAIYSAIYTVFNALFVDRVHQQNITTQVLVVTKLRDLEPFWELGRKMDRGITYWSGHGAYTGDEVQILCICLSKYEIETLRQEVRKVDPHAFFMVQEGVHTLGNFKRHLKKPSRYRAGRPGKPAVCPGTKARKGGTPKAVEMLWASRCFLNLFA